MTPQPTKLILYTDGGSRGNPGPSAYGFVIYNGDMQKLYEEGKYIGIATNNIAEYTAVVKGFEKAKELSGSAPVSLDVYMDSEIVQRQLSGQYRVKHENLIPLFTTIKSNERWFISINYVHVRRHLNSAADMQVNRALDKALF